MLLNQATFEHAINEHAQKVHDMSEVVFKRMIIKTWFNSDLPQSLKVNCMYNSNRKHYHIQSSIEKKIEFIAEEIELSKCLIGNSITNNKNCIIDS